MKNKRLIIGVVLALLGLIVVTGLGLLLAGDDRRLGATQKSYAGSRFAVEIDGASAGVVNSIKGCGVGANVVREELGAADQVVRKHVGQVVYEPCVIEVPVGNMSQPLFSWIADMLASKAPSKNVAVVTADYNFKEKSRTTLSQALLTKVRFPALDGASKDPAPIQLTIEAENVTKVKGNGSTVQGTYSAKSQKKWLPSNFRFALDGISDLNQVSSISALEVTQEVTQDASGEVKAYQQQAGNLEVGDLTFSISASHTQSLDTWFDDFVIKGNSAQENEKSGTIEFLDPSMKNVLLALAVKGVGIFRATEPTQDASEKVPRKIYSLYVEELSFGAVSSSLASTAGGGETSTPLQTNPQPLQPTTTSTVEASIFAVSGDLLADGETFTISDGVNPPTTFEFDLDGQAEGVAIRFEKGAPADVVAGAIIEAINSVPEELQIFAKSTGEPVIQLQSERGGEAGEEKIIEFVENESFRVRDAVVAREPEGLPAPTELQATTGASEGEIELSWQPSPGALGYLVLFKTEPESDYRELEKTEETKLPLAGLDSGVTHYFVVRALDGTRESPNSNEASAPAG